MAEKQEARTTMGSPLITVKPVTCYEDKTGNIHRTQVGAALASARSIFGEAVSEATSQGEFFPLEFLEELKKNQQLREAMILLCSHINEGD